MKLHQLTLPQRLAAGLGCVVLLAIVMGGVVFLAFDLAARRRVSTELAAAPPGWADTLRAIAKAPDLTALALPRTVEGDGSFIAHDSTQNWARGNVEEAYRAIVSGAGTRADSSLWREIYADTGLGRFVGAARMSDWKALDRVIAAGGERVRRNLLALPAPKYAPLRNAVRGLVIRGLQRLARRDAAGAREDLGAAVSLGEQVFRREPSAIGNVMGRSMLASATRGWTRYAAVTGDTAIGARAATASRWASAQSSPVAQLLVVAPDTALSLARDTTLALGMRTEALVNVMSAWMLRPRGFLFGPPGRYTLAIRELKLDRDPEFARIAEMASETAKRMRVGRLGALLEEARR